MKTNKQASSNNVFQTIVRKVVREELEPVKGEFKKEMGVMGENMVKMEKRLDNKWNFRFAQLEERMYGLEEKLDKFRDEIMTGIDKITGMFKKHEEEHQILSSQHQRLIDLEEKVEVLEKVQQVTAR